MLQATPTRVAALILTAFDRALERASIVFLRSLDDVTILAASPEALAAGLGTAKSLLESLGMSLRDAVDPVKRPAAGMAHGNNRH